MRYNLGGGRRIALFVDEDDEQARSFALATALNLVRPKLWHDEDFSWMRGKTVRLAMLDQQAEQIKWLRDQVQLLTKNIVQQ